MANVLRIHFRGIRAKISFA